MSTPTSPITWEHQAGLTETALAACQKAVEQVDLLRWILWDEEISIKAAGQLSDLAEAVATALEEAENAFAAADGKALDQARNDAWFTFNLFKDRDAARIAADEANDIYWLGKHETPEDWERAGKVAIDARAARDAAEEICEAITLAAWSKA